jgi:hypothetical protein
MLYQYTAYSTPTVISDSSNIFFTFFTNVKLSLNYFLSSQRLSCCGQEKTAIIVGCQLDIGTRACIVPKHFSLRVNPPLTVGVTHQETIGGFNPFRFLRKPIRVNVKKHTAEGVIFNIFYATSVVNRFLCGEVRETVFTVVGYWLLTKKCKMIIFT